MNIVDTLKTYVETLQTYVAQIPYAEFIVPVVVAVLAIIVANNGKKLINFFKFLICAAAGFAAGYVVVYPYVAAYLTSVPYAQLIVAAVLALVAALLCKILYPIAFAAAFGYVAYLAIPTLVASVPAIAVVGQYQLVAAIVVAVLALILRGLIEMLGTAVLGGYGFYWALDSLLVAITAKFALGTGAGYELGTGAMAFVVLLIALIGFIKQVKNRHRF